MSVVWTIAAIPSIEGVLLTPQAGGSPNDLVEWTDIARESSFLIVLSSPLYRSYFPL